jgi:hypothetical protein
MAETLFLYTCGSLAFLKTSNFLVQKFLIQNHPKIALAKQLKVVDLTPFSKEEGYKNGTFRSTLKLQRLPYR